MALGNSGDLQEQSEPVTGKSKLVMRPLSGSDDPGSKERESILFMRA
jgi:hypothetical protein